MDYEQQTAHYLALAEQMLDEAFGERRAEWLQRMEAELPQIRYVLDWLQAQEQVESGLQLAFLLQEIWFETAAYAEEGLSYLQDFLAMSAEPSALRANCLDLGGAIAMFVDKLEMAAAWKAEGIAILRSLGDQHQLGYALIHQGHLLSKGLENYLEAEKVYREALVILTECDDQAGTAHAMSNLAGVLLETGDYKSAQMLAEASLRRYVALDFEWDVAVTLAVMGGAVAGLGEFERAVWLAAVSHAHRQRIGVSLPEAFQKRYEKYAAMAATGLDEKRWAALWAAGEAMTLEEGVACALEGNR